MTWRPLSERDDRESDYDALNDGVPVWLAGTLVEFVSDAVRYDDPFGFAQGFIASRVREVERRLHIPLGTGSDDLLGRRLIDALIANGTLLLDAVDLTLMWNGEDRVVDLAGALAEAGSAWMVRVDGSDVAHLQRRVESSTVAAARGVMTNSGRAGQHLAAAWTSIYGRSPNPSHGYREAVRAVETAARPVISPTNDRATLGTMIADFNSKPEKWSFVLQPNRGDAIGTVADMMQLLWTSQLDRHGTDDESIPSTVTIYDAEAAVHLATTLVHWFSQGFVSPAA
jgi:hypothetical protein